MKRIISRRRFLISGVATMTAAVAGWAYLQEFTYHNLIISVLHRKLSYLELDESSLGKFAADFAGDYGTLGHKGQLLALSRPVLPLVDSLAADEVTRFEDRVVSKFLLSTDFFRNGADETRPVKYVAYNNPYNFACGNPFAILDEA